MLNGKTAVRVPAAVASLFAGSFALAYEDWVALQEREAQANTK